MKTTVLSQTEALSMIENQQNLIVSLLNDEQKQFIKTNYRLEPSGSCILPTFKIKSNPTINKTVNDLLKLKVGCYHSSIGHTIPSSLISKF